MRELFHPYSRFLQRRLGGRVQKIPVDAGAACPVRDGTLGRGGCAFCNRRSFVPGFCTPAVRVSGQIAAGKRFFSRRTGDTSGVRYLAYFQSGSNTYGPVERLGAQLAEAAGADGVCGVVVATRPDCLGAAWLDFLQDLSRRTFVMVELGMESADDTVLRQVGRGHGYRATAGAVCRLAQRGIPVGVHCILGLPGESRAGMLRQARLLSGLPVDVVKLHQLQIVRGARMEADYRERPDRFSLLTAEAYVQLVADYLERLSPHIAVERFVSQSPPGELVAPRWGLKPDAVVRAVSDELARRGSWQGRLCQMVQGPVRRR